MFFHVLVDPVPGTGLRAEGADAHEIGLRVDEIRGLVGALDHPDLFVPSIAGVGQLAEAVGVLMVLSERLGVDLFPLLGVPVVQGVEHRLLRLGFLVAIVAVEAVASKSVGDPAAIASNLARRILVGEGEVKLSVDLELGGAAAVLLLEV
jgi:hypothetical protein